MTEAAIRSDIYDAVSAVSNVGKVYNRARYVNEWPDYLNLFKTTIGGTTQIRGWEIEYRGFTDVPMEFANSGAAMPAVRGHNFLIRGWMGIDDSASSETTFAALAETVCDALDDNSTLNTTYYATELSTLVFTQGAPGGVLAHLAEITKVVWENV